MKSDIEIAREVSLRKIKEIATGLGIPREEVQNYGRYIAKIPLHLIDEEKIKQHNLILVTAITPTKAGIGKTTVSIGLALGLNKIGKKAVVALREPSLGPCFGMKGGAAGGGYSQVLPMENINLHFTGDFHAVTSAHNMITALLDNYIYQTRNTCEGLKEIKWKRVLDVNDRSLRNIVSGLGGSANGVPTETGFDITPASEIMAILCLATDIEDLKRRVGNILLGYTNDDKPFTVNDLGVAGAITVLLKDALLPNLVQTTENTAAFVHGGPFANIAHGCNSVLATKMALTYGDYVITEAGFGADGPEFEAAWRRTGRQDQRTEYRRAEKRFREPGQACREYETFRPGSDRDLQQICIRYGRGNRAGCRTLSRDRCRFLYEQRICCRWRRGCRAGEIGGRHDRKETFRPAQIHLRGQRTDPQQDQKGIRTDLRSRFRCLHDLGGQENQTDRKPRHLPLPDLHRQDTVFVLFRPESIRGGQEF